MKNKENKKNILTIILIIILLAIVVVLLSRTTNILAKLNIMGGYNVGDLIEYKNNEDEMLQEFYVLSDDGDSLTLLAKDNLLVGNTYDIETGMLTEIADNKLEYGIQSSEATGFNTNYTIYNGVVEYDEKCHEEGNCNSYGTSKGYKPTISKYLDDYKDILINKYNLNVKKVRLLMTSDFMINGLLKEELSDAIRNRNSYWIDGLSDKPERAKCIIDNGALAEFNGNVNNRLGVRPVIVISK